MAAFEVPWIDPMSSNVKESNRHSLSPNNPNNGDPTPTYAAFSPSTSVHSSSSAQQRSTILVHQKSPLLVATPPQITRALAYSHPFLEPLNKLVGLLSWTTGDPWESFLLVAAFWGVTLYGDIVLRWTAPILSVIALILGMYVRRYSPMSSTSWSGEKGAKKHKRADSDVMRQHKSLDEIVDALRLFTSRCSILLDPLLRMTDFLSTQRTATSATTQPALTILFIRILLITPIWILLTLPPIYLITTRRTILCIGTIVLTWHSRPARVCRLILWRSRLIRRFCATITGLDFANPDVNAHRESGTGKGPKTPHQIAASLAAKRRPESPGIRFTFALFENQRRWLGIGWTSSMLAYERGSWTDEHLNAASPKEKFQLPEVEGGHARWRWVDGSEWHVEGSDEHSVTSKGKGDEDDGGWIYYDNKWRDGRRDRDGWGRYTRRRKWCRSAELVEISPSTEITPSPTPKPMGNSSRPDLTDIRAAAAALSESFELSASQASSAQAPTLARTVSSSYSSATANSEMESSTATIKRKGWFRRSSQTPSERSASFSTSNLSTASSNRSREEDEDDVHTPYRKREAENSWGVGDEAAMGFG